VISYQEGVQDLSWQTESKIYLGRRSPRFILAEGVQDLSWQEGVQDLSWQKESKIYLGRRSRPDLSLLSLEQALAGF
jgi:hypothetical protein